MSQNLPLSVKQVVSTLVASVSAIMKANEGLMLDAEGKLLEKNVDDSIERCHEPPIRTVLFDERVKTATSTTPLKEQQNPLQSDSFMLKPRRTTQCHLQTARRGQKRPAESMQSTVAALATLAASNTAVTSQNILNSPVTLMSAEWHALEHLQELALKSPSVESASPPSKTVPMARRSSPGLDTSSFFKLTPNASSFRTPQSKQAPFSEGNDNMHSLSLSSSSGATRKIAPLTVLRHDGCDYPSPFSHSSRLSDSGSVHDSGDKGHDEVLSPFIAKYGKSANVSKIETFKSINDNDRLYSPARSPPTDAVDLNLKDSTQVSESSDDTATMSEQTTVPVVALTPRSRIGNSSTVLFSTSFHGDAEDKKSSVLSSQSRCNGARNNREVTLESFRIDRVDCFQGDDAHERSDDCASSLPVLQEVFNDLVQQGQRGVSAFQKPLALFNHGNSCDTLALLSSDGDDTFILVPPSSVSRINVEIKPSHKQQRLNVLPTDVAMGEFLSPVDGLFEERSWDRCFTGEDPKEHSSAAVLPREGISESRQLATPPAMNRVTTPPPLPSRAELAHRK